SACQSGSSPLPSLRTPPPAAARKSDADPVPAERTTFWPSGDHTGVESGRPAMRPRRAPPPPFGATTSRSLGPRAPNRRTKTILVPVGDQSGKTSTAFVGGVESFVSPF